MTYTNIYMHAYIKARVYKENFLVGNSSQYYSGTSTLHFAYMNIRHTHVHAYTDMKYV